MMKYKNVEWSYSIAAAPELLEALEFVCKMYSENPSHFPVNFQTAINIAELAIVKAGGGKNE